LERNNPGGLKVNSESKKILIIDAGREWREEFRNAFYQMPGVKVLEASTLRAAEEILATNPDVVLVTVDGQLEETKIQESCEFVATLRASGFKGAFVAASSNASYRQLLTRAGCSDHYDKQDLARAIRRMLR